MNIYFWNINNSLAGFNLAKKLVQSDPACIVIVSEFWNITLEEPFPKGIKFLHDDIHKRVGIIYNESNKVNFRRSAEYYLLSSIKYNSLEILICSIHFKSKLSGDKIQKRVIDDSIRKINEELNTFDSNNKIIIGDFNVEPHDESLLNVFSFNSVSTVKYRNKLHKTYMGNDYDIYYNPFYSFYGDLSDGPAGTYFYEVEAQTQAWHIFDQALINSKLIKNLDVKNCAILTEICSVDLSLENGKPKTIYSDHFPIKIKIK